MKFVDISKEPWHSIPFEETADKLAVDVSAGLASEKVRNRQERFGLNQITRQKKVPAWMRFSQQFNQPLIYILVVAAGITLWLKGGVDASVIFGVVLVNSIVGFIQESKALKEIDALSRSMTAQATVIRSGKKEQVLSTEIVPGDIVIISSGDKVPADLRLFSVRNLRLNESALTGESAPVEKRTGVVKADAVLADRNNMAYASTLVAYGQAKGVVTAIGDNTQVGRISRLVSTAEDLQTPLTIKIDQFSHKLLYVILALAVSVFIIGVMRGNSLAEMFMAAVALAVGAIPEGLPAAVTITLAIGVARMAKRNAIIRNLPAVETLGSTSVICSDKTGTLTENQMTVQRILSGGQIYDVSGKRYSSEGEISAAGEDNSLNQALQECLTAGYLCNDSQVVEKDAKFMVEGDPTEGALIVSARKAQSIIGKDIQELPRLDSIPFESEYQYMATLHKVNKEKNVIYVKGSIEKVLSRCGRELKSDGVITELNREAVEKKAENMASQGLRILAFARIDVAEDKKNIGHEDIKESLIFLGLQGMIDPARAEAIEAVKSCYSAGIQVKMITGDHVVTAKAIAQKLRLKNVLSSEDVSDEIRALSGEELESLNDEDLASIVNNVPVFARVTPEQKIRLVRALQAHDYITAMTGDGVNDAPALKQANIGIAMGFSGTEVAKESADMVLADDNFASIEAAVEEGRCVFDNLRKFIVWTIPTNLGEALAIMIAIFGGILLPIAPVQILWVNMTTALCLGMTLAFEAKEPGLMRRSARDPETPIMTGELLVRTIFVGVLLALGVFGFFLYQKKNGASIEEARTAAVSLLVFGELFYLFACRSLARSMLRLGFFSNRWMIFGVCTMAVLQIMFVYLPVMNVFFHSAPISLASWIVILLAGVFIYSLVEVEKWFRLHLSNRKKDEARKR